MSKRKWFQRQREMQQHRLEEKQRQNLQASQTRAFVMEFKGEMFAGPLPHPSILAEYDKISPGAATRIIAMAESQQAHRHHLEKTVIEGNTVAAKRGQIFAFALGAIGILAGASLLALGRDIQGFTVLIGAIGSLVGVFVLGRRREEKERERKQQSLPPQVR